LKKSLLKKSLPWDELVVQG
jgi:hypothetical protein